MGNRSRMARPALIFLTIALAAMQFSVMADSPEADGETRDAPEDDPSDRAASASAHAVAKGMNVAPRPYPPPTVRPLPQTSAKCFACSGCATLRNNTVYKTCPYSPDPRKNGKCVDFTEKYFHMSEPWVVRGCVSERGTCAEIKAAIDPQSELVKLISCKECDGDLCNGAAHSVPDLMAALTAVFITPLLMKYTLS